MKSKIKKYILLVIVLTFLPIIKVKAAECVTYKEGSGTKEDPYVIKTPEELYSINCNLDKSFILGNDIDLTYETTNKNGLFYNDGYGWLPIANNDIIGYKGTFDGNNKKIIGINQNLIVEENNYNGGLFFAIEGEIKNLTLENVNITYRKNENALPFGSSIGILATSLNNGKISNIIASGNIEISLDNDAIVTAAGIISGSNNSEIDNCKNYVNINVTKTDETNQISSVAGIVSIGANLTIKNSINYGNFSGIISAGGVANSLNNSSVYNCKNFGNIDVATEYSNGAGGVVNYIISEPHKQSTISNSANYGTLSAYIVGGIAVNVICSGGGCDAQNVIVRESFNIGDIYSNGGGTGGLVAGLYNATIIDSFNSGNIYLRNHNSDTTVGGLVGSSDELLNGQVGHIKNSYNAGMIFNIGEDNNEYYIGEILSFGAYPEILNTYFLIPNFPSNILGKYQYERIILGEKLKFSESTKATSYKNFDFDNIWFVNKDSNYVFPQLKNNPIEVNYPEETLPNIQIDNIKNELTVGESIQYYLKKTSTNVEDEKILWQVENIEGTATITENGTVTAKEKGKVLVRAIYKNFNAVYDEVELNINPIFVNQIDISGIDVINVGENTNYKSTIFPENAENQKIEWSIENITGKAEITEDGTMYPISRGTVKVIAKSTDGSNVIATKNITIKDPQILQVKVDKTKYDLTIDSEEFIIEPQIITQDNPSYEVKWASVNEDVIKIENGHVKIVGIGQTIITITVLSNNEIREIIYIDMEVTSPIKSISLDKSVNTITVNAGRRLSATFNPQNTTDDKKLIWESSDEEILSIDDQGYIKALKKGTVIVSVTTINGKKDSMEIIVKDPQILEIKLDKEKYDLAIDSEDFVIEPQVITQDNPSYEVKWESSNENIVKVNNGKIQVVGVGKATIKITAFSNNPIITLTKEIEINVKRKNPIFELINGVVDFVKSVIKRIAPNTKLETLYNSIKNNENIIIYGHDGHVIYDKVMNSKQNIKTGDYIEYINSEEQLIHLDLSVSGDLSGDGEIDSLDLATMMNHVSEKKTLDGPYLESAYLNNDEEIDSLDLAYLMNHIAGKEGY